MMVRITDVRDGGTAVRIWGWPGAVETWEVLLTFRGFVHGPAPGAQLVASPPSVTLGYVYDLGGGGAAPPTLRLVLGRPPGPAPAFVDLELPGVFMPSPETCQVLAGA